MKSFKKLFFLGLLAPCVALAGLSTTPATITGTSAACFTIGSLPAGQLGPTAQFLLVKNESTADTIAFRVGYSSLPTAAINTAGNITLAPGQEQFISSSLLNGSYLACISSGTSTPATFMIY